MVVRPEDADGGEYHHREEDAGDGLIVGEKVEQQLPAAHDELQHAQKPLPEAAAGAKGFWGGIALNLSNPKPALFYAALILSVFHEPMATAQQGLIYAICLATELFWYATVAVLMSTATMRSRYFAAKFWIDRTAAIAMAALGLLLIVKH